MKIMEITPFIPLTLRGRFKGRIVRREILRFAQNDRTEGLGTASFDSVHWLILQLAQRRVMLTEYIEAAMRKAKYEILSDDNTFYGYIPGFDGVYANAEDLETCRSELKEVLEEWIMLGISRHLPLPIVDGIKLVVEEAV